MTTTDTTAAATAAAQWLQTHQDESIGRLIDWLRIPSIGADPAFDDETRRAGQWAVDRLREVGIDAGFKETGTPEKRGHPIVYAEHKGAGEGAPWVLFYGHYDVQPADPLELWDSAPFEPTIAEAVQGGPGKRVVARGAADDKGQTHTFLEALRAWHETAGEIPVNIIVLIEGEEESGSKNLERFLRQSKDALAKASYCVLSDTGMLGRGKPAITYGVRGLSYVEITLQGPDQDLHSGIWGGKVPNPLNELTKVLAQLWDEKRRVTVPGFYDGVNGPSTQESARWAELPLDVAGSLQRIGLRHDGDVGEQGFTAIEREWARPTCDINGAWGGYTGAGAKTVIPSVAHAKISFRLVDDQDAEKITNAFFQWCNERTPPGCSWTFTDHSGGPPATLPLDSVHLEPAREAMREAARNIFGPHTPEPAMIKSGGSIPVVGMFKGVLGLDSVMLGFGLEDDRVHSPNEKFEIDCFRLGAATYAGLIGRWAERG